MVWRHPKYYKELEKRRKELQRQQADKPTSQQAIEETVPHNDIEEAKNTLDGTTPETSKIWTI